MARATAKQKCYRHLIANEKWEKDEAKMFVAWTISSWILRQFVNGENQP